VGDWERGGEGGHLPIPTAPHSPLPGPPLTVRTEQLLPSKAHVRAPNLGRGLGEGGPGWGVPPLPVRGSPYQHAAAQDPHRQQQRQLARGRALRLQRTRAGSAWLGPPPRPPQPRAAHLCDGVEGGFGLALPAPVLAQGSTEGRGDAGGEAQAQLQPPDAHRDVPGGLCRHRRERGARGMPEGMRGVRDPGAGLCSPPQVPLAHGAHLAGGDTPRGCCSRRRTGGEQGSAEGLGDLPSPTAAPSPFPGSAHPPGGAYPEAQQGVNIHLVQRVCLVRAESGSPSPTRTAHGHPGAHLQLSGDPGVWWVPQPGAWPCTPLGWCPTAPQCRVPSPAPPHWPWSWGCHGRAQSQLPPPSSTGWPGGAGGSWHSAPSPSGPCCWRCGRGIAPRTTARGRLRGTTSAGRGDRAGGTPGTRLPSPRALTGGRLVVEGAAFAARAVVVGVGGLGSRVGRSGQGVQQGRARGWRPQGSDAPRRTGRAPGTRTAARRGGRLAPAPAARRQR